MRFQITLSLSFGFQNAQFSFMTFTSTVLINLVNIIISNIWENHNAHAKSIIFFNFKQKRIDDFIISMKYYHKNNGI